MSRPGVEPAPVTVEPVSGRAGLDRFIRVAPPLHAGDAAYVAPLVLERQGALSPDKNPFFDRADVQFWVARRNGSDVGRISAQIDREGLRHRGGATGHFGLLEAADDPAVFAALTGIAEAWLRDRGMTEVQGPFSLSINEETGLLVDGFDFPPMLLMPHDARYAGARLEEQGYAKVKDVIAYLYDVDGELPPAATAMIRRGVPPNVVIRPMNMADYAGEIRLITAIFNDAWSQNWGFVPWTEADTNHLARELRPLLDGKLVWFAEVDGKPAAFIVCLPNLNEAIAGLNGSLLPFGWAKLLWRLKVTGVKTARVPLMGVRRHLANSLTGALVPFLIIDAVRREARAKGFRQIELSWILEDNMPMRRIIEAIGGRGYKTYRIYRKGLL